MLIRQAKLNELPELVEWACQFMKQVFPKHEVDKAHLEAMGVALQQSHVLLVAEEDGELRGFIAGIYQRHFLNPNVSLLQEVAWWVPEKWRNTYTGWALLKTFSALKNTDMTSVGLLQQSGVADRHMEKLGYKKFETAWVKDNG